MKKMQDAIKELTKFLKDCKALSDEKAKKISFEKLNALLEVITNNISKFDESASDSDVVEGFLKILPCVAQLCGTPPPVALMVLPTLFRLSRKLKKPPASESLSKNVHEELVDFNRRLQDQKNAGLCHRMSYQIAQLETMSPGEKLNDTNLWHEYKQFMGELSKTVENPLRFKYKKESLTGDPEVADFVTAVSTYCKAFSCFMFLLAVAKLKFEELGVVHKSNEVDETLNGLKEHAKKILSFLSEPKYLTFLGRLPCEGGKLLKIVALTRWLADKHVVENVRSTLGLEPMPDFTTVENAAEKVSRQSVKLEEGRHLVPPCGLWNALKSIMTAQRYWVQFVNETSFPMKVVSKPQESNHGLRVLFDVPAYSSPSQGLSWIYSFSDCGYFILYLKGDLSSNMEPPATDVIVVEFALSQGGVLDFIRWKVGKINLKDKSAAEFTWGQDAFSTMQYGDVQPLYLSKGDAHFMVKAEIIQPWYFWFATWRFSVQSFDPLTIDG
ncbi:uncharacterized protein LOC122948644 [Acropora millepora]|uniref:uncharacterized protein LOC122948644 n=1 Tax=Acropora millepora TaxID=45264 RepID=UPI001CF4C96E|nr:uncharacterized protein LOC122948644 [Acropora millepora]XP_044164637.1 uncharacterized protein LOC122948644 [Acropora millepora]XP_044164638.1 uncharacterized protein LOC122948644 [Acropora millepora]XP_044164639.1 uncharacterized protein LOC122948644 [Acropora millepora]